MTQRIIYTNESGDVFVVVPTPGSGLTIQEVADKDVPKGVAYDVVDTAIVPSDRTFRHAWRKNGFAIETDMVKARDIKRDMLREERVALLQAEDIAFMQALETKQSTAAIVARKQALRDVTADPAIERAETEAELKAFRPAVFDA